MSTMASQITGVFIVCPIVGSGTDQRKHQSSASLAFVRGIHQRAVNSPHRRPVTRKTFPFDDVIMLTSTKPQQNTIKHEPYVLDILWSESTATEISCWRNLRHWLHWVGVVEMTTSGAAIGEIFISLTLPNFLFCEDKPKVYHNESSSSLSYYLIPLLCHLVDIKIFPGKLIQPSN